MQALRAARRAQRKVDTKIEVMERRLDRSIENKERITFTVLESILKDYSGVIDLVKILEAVLTDTVIIFNATNK